VLEPVVSPVSVIASISEGGIRSSMRSRRGY
jgi:hypothetical protein